jgi:hypothetical protein
VRGSTSTIDASRAMPRLKQSALNRLVKVENTTMTFTPRHSPAASTNEGVESSIRRGPQARRHTQRVPNRPQPSASSEPRNPVPRPRVWSAYPLPSAHPPLPHSLGRERNSRAQTILGTLSGCLQLARIEGDAAATDAVLTAGRRAAYLLADVAPEGRAMSHGEGRSA